MAFYRIIVLAIASALMFLIQTFFLPSAGKNISDRSYKYTFQANHWNEVIYRKFDNIVDSGSWKKVGLYKDKVSIDDNFFPLLLRYDHFLGRFYEAINYNGETGIEIISSLEELIPKAAIKMSPDERKEVQQFFKDYKSQQDKYFAKFNEKQEITKKIKRFQDEEYGEEIDARIALHRLLVDLYRSESYHLNGNIDSFEFIRDHAELTKTAIDHYRVILEAYNKQVDLELAIKNIILLLIVFITLYATISDDSAWLKIKSYFYVFIKRTSQK